MSRSLYHKYKKQITATTIYMDKINVKFETEVLMVDMAMIHVPFYKNTS